MPFDFIVGSKFSRLENFGEHNSHDLAHHSIPNVTCLECRKFCTATKTNVKRKLWDSPQGQLGVAAAFFFYFYIFCFPFLSMTADEPAQLPRAPCKLICKNWIWLSIKSWTLPSCGRSNIFHWQAFRRRVKSRWKAAEAAKAINRARKELSSQDNTKAEVGINLHNLTETSAAKGGKLRWRRL